MAKIIKPLTDTQIKKAKTEEKTYTLGDGKGMHLEVNKNGGKWWRFRFKLDGKSYNRSLGTYPEVSLAAARKNRDKARAIIATDNRDPFKSLNHKEDKKEQNTFRYWADYYFERASKELSETHISRTLKSFKKDVYPHMGDMLINNIRARDVIAVLHIMRDRGAIESARKTFSAINRVFSVAISNFPDDIDRNPTADISLSDVIGKKVVVSYPVITDPKELGKLLNIIAGYQGDTSTRLALMMLPHVFTRPTVLRLATWDEINLETKQWIIPKEKMKTKKELVVPLTSQVLSILEEARHYSKGSELVFPSNRSRTSPMSDNALVGALRRMDYSRDEIVAHSFRGIFSTIAHELSEFSHDIIETQLAHSVGSAVSQAYNRAKYLNERSEMMVWWSDYLSKIQRAAAKAAKDK